MSDENRLFNMSDESRLFHLYQIFMDLTAGEFSGEIGGERYGQEYDEFYMADGESGEYPDLTPEQVRRLGRAIVKIAEEAFDEFHSYPPTLREVAQALIEGPALYLQFAEDFKATADAVISEWNLKFPECKTYGEMKEAKRLAGPRLQ